jgi:hypothetical protein
VVVLPGLDEVPKGEHSSGEWEGYMSDPKRIQRKRTKGWRMPEGAVYVGRPTYFGNLFKIGVHTNAAYGGVLVRDHAHAVELFREYLEKNPIIAADAARSLRGRDLVCWCPLVDAEGRAVPCHADVLLAIANEGTDPDGASA